MEVEVARSGPMRAREREEASRHGRLVEAPCQEVEEVIMERHVRIVGNIFIAKGFLSFFWIVFSLPFIPRFPFFFFLVIPNILVGVALKRHRSWARSAAVCLAAMNLPYLPLGTAISIYMLWVLFSRRTNQLFVTGSILHHGELPVHVRETPAVTLRCPYCREPMSPEEPIRRCTACHTRHHEECWRLNGQHCTTFACESRKFEIVPTSAI